MKIKIIDLFNKIANNEKVPKKIKFHGETYYYSKPDKFYYCDGYSIYRELFGMTNSLNAEVEIIGEEKDIEKLGKNFTFEDSTNELTKSDWQVSVISQKINELVDEVNKLKKKGEV